MLRVLAPSLALLLVAALAPPAAAVAAPPCVNLREESIQTSRASASVFPLSICVDGHVNGTFPADVRVETLIVGTLVCVHVPSAGISLCVPIDLRACVEAKVDVPATISFC